MSTLHAPHKGLARHGRVVERLNRLKQRELENTRQRITQIQVMIADFERIANILEGEIRVEQDRTKNYDPAHVAYSNSARSMIQRRDNLKLSIEELKRQLADAKAVLEAGAFSAGSEKSADMDGSPSR